MSWLLMLLIAVTALFLGSRVVAGPGQQARRVAALDAQIRCPSCSDLSVAESDDPTAIAVRQAVSHEVRAGWSDSQIEANLVGRYGQGILLRPPTSGVSALLWVIPLLAMAAVAGAGGALLYRRRRPRARHLEGRSDDDDDTRLVESALGQRRGARA